MNFLEAVNRVLRLEAVLQGDDDDLTSFTQTQHAATSSLAQLAIQSQLADLVSDGFIDYEDAEGTFTSTNLTRTYSLASDFQRMQELFIEELDSSSEASPSRSTPRRACRKRRASQFSPQPSSSSWQCSSTNARTRWRKAS